MVSSPIHSGWISSLRATKRFSKAARSETTAKIDGENEISSRLVKPKSDKIVSKLSG